ncbi:MAG TPA: hypothetical protein VGI60_17610 [Chthoniobacterales bacterium]
MAAQFTFTPGSQADPGDLYVTDLSSGSVIKYAPDGSSIVYATGLTSPQGIALDQAKNVFVADAGSGENGDGEIVKYDHADKTKSVVLDGLNNPVGLALDGNDLLVSDNNLGRVIRVPIGFNFDNPSLFRILDNPLGIASHSFPPKGTDSEFNRFIATGASVIKVNPDGTTTDIDPGDNSRGVAVTSITISGTAVEAIFVTTDDGNIDLILNETKLLRPLVTGLEDPVGMDFRPSRFNGDTEDVGDLYVADRGAGEILKIEPGADPQVFASGGEPNYMVFETNATPPPTPTPSPTISPTPTPTPTPSPVPVGKALNISTRVDVETGDDVAIAGFIITGGTTPKTVAIRGIGPSLGASGVANTLSDPVLELHMPDGTVVTNDNWKDNSATDQGIIVAAGLNLSGTSTISDSESIVIATLPPRDDSDPGSGQYTAVMRGANGATGVGLVEVYDLDDPSVVAELANISTRGIVGTADNVLIGGLIVGPDNSLNTSVIVRAIGPSLANVTQPVADSLSDPFVDLHNGNGDVITSNDNWQDGENADLIMADKLAPTDSAEGAIFANLIPGLYTAIVMGNNAGVGVALVEIYHVPTPAAK